jgi:hypothetical protein
MFVADCRLHECKYSVQNIFPPCFVNKRISCLFYFLWPLWPAHCRYKGLLLRFVTLNDTQTHTHTQLMFVLYLYETRVSSLRKYTYWWFVRRGWWRGRNHSEEFRALYSSPDVRVMRWTGQFVITRGAYEMCLTHVRCRPRWGHLAYPCACERVLLTGWQCAQWS